MRSIKSTTLSCGLVSVPMKVYCATDNHDLKLSQFHDGCGGGVGYVKTCKCCNETLDSAQIVRGVIRDDKQIIISDDDLAGLENEVGPEIAVQQFVNLDEIDPIYFENHYFLSAASAADLEGYMTIRTVMAESNRAAIVRFVMRRSGGVGKEHLGLLAPYGDKAMIIHTLAWADEVRQPAFSLLDTPVKLNPKVLDMARGLVDAMTEPFDPQAFNDLYTEQLAGLIDSRVNNKPAKKAAAAKEDRAEVSDLLAKLTASTKAAAKKPAAKKAAPAKAPAKRAGKKAAVA